MRPLVARMVPLLVVVALLDANGDEPRRVEAARAAPVHDQPLMRRKRAPAFPGRAAVLATRHLAGRRAGDVSFAVIDTRGRLRGLHVHRRYRSASVTKAMLLVAYMRAHRHPSPAVRSVLSKMVRFSDNDSASAIYPLVGDAAMQDLGRRAGMTHLVTTGTWSDVWITAADQARFFRRVRRLTPRRHRPYVLGLLSSIAPEQSWGIPRGAPKGVRVYFKGGWRPEGERRLVHQAALVERGHLRVPIAVLTTADPSHGYGASTIRRIAARLLDGAAEHPLAQGRTR